MSRRKDQIKSLLLIIAKQEKIIAEQEKCIAELKRRLDLDSSNSGKPPSSDGLKKPPSRTQSLRKKSGKKPGGQPGHKGTTLKQVENPDLIEYYKLTSCPHCETDLTNVPVSNTLSRQVFDIPIIQKQVTEHQFEIKCCPKCHNKVKHKKADQVKAPVQYGNNVKAFATYLRINHLIPEERTAQIMDECFDLPMSAATITSFERTCYANVNQVVEEIEARLKITHFKGADESGVRINGKTRWLHTLCNNELVHYRASDKRGDVPTDVKGIVIHDHFASYYSKMNDDNLLHALCNAHHLRELKAVIEIDKEPWARRMYSLLLIGCNAKRNFQNISVEWLAKFKRLYNLIISKGLAYHEKLGVFGKPKRGRVKRRHGHNLLLRLEKRSEDTLRFLHDSDVHFTNNISERALRMIKVKQKISGCFRTSDGAKNFLTIRSYTATAQRQGYRILDVLIAAFQNTPFKLVGERVAE